tara:strand:+ start:126 stop:320 length:195 start_codon:yes stop_codon:yes gene_type:complete
MSSPFSDAIKAIESLQKDLQDILSDQTNALDPEITDAIENALDRSSTVVEKLVPHATKITSIEK